MTNRLHARGLDGRPRILRSGDRSPEEHASRAECAPVPGGPAPPRPRLRSAAALLLLAALALPGCASLGGSSGESHRTGPVQRPDAPADYDVLVGNLAAIEGRTGQARAAFERAAAKDPDSAYLQRSLGRLAAQMEDLEGALEHGRRAFELDPTDADARLFLGRLHRIRRDVEGAETALRGEDGAPINAEASLLLFQIYLESNRLPEALSVADDLVATQPEILGGHMAVATAYERMGQRDEAEAALRRALVHHPGRFVLYSRLARARRAADDRPGEIAVYREILEVHPEHYATLVSLAEAQIAVGDIEGAIATYSRLLDYYPDDPQSVRRLASLELSAGRPERAAERLAEALGRSPDSEELAFALGRVLREVGNEEAAFESFERIPADHEIYPDARLQIAEMLEGREEYDAALVEIEKVRALRPSRPLHFHTAALRWRAGDLESGVALLEEMLAESPGDDEVLYQLGVLYGMAKQVDKALEYMHATLEENPSNPHALNYIGYTWAERGENLEEAEAMIQRALELRPDDGYITDSLGWVYYMRARPLIVEGRVEDGRLLLERAREHLVQAAQLTGGDPVVSEHLGDVYLLLDQKELALEFYEEALSLDPRTEEQPDLLDKLEGLRKELQRQ